MNLTKVMERMNVVRRARRHFLKMWAIDQTVITPALDRVAEDLGKVETAKPQFHPPAPNPGIGETAHRLGHFSDQEP